MKITTPEPTTENAWLKLKSMEWGHIKRIVELGYAKLTLSTTLGNADKCNLARLLRENGYAGEADVLEAAQEIAQ